MLLLSRLFNCCSSYWLHTEADKCQVLVHVHAVLTVGALMNISIVHIVLLFSVVLLHESAKTSQAETAVWKQLCAQINNFKHRELQDLHFTILNSVNFCYYHLWSYEIN